MSDDLRDVHTLALGTASFAGVNMVGHQQYRAPTLGEVSSLISSAIESLYIEGGREGLLMLDTSAQYGWSERLIGRFLRANPDVRRRICLATKWGLHFDSEDFCRWDFSLENLDASVRRSAELLGPIDLLYLHTNPGVPTEALKRFVEGRDGVYERMREWRRSEEFGIRYIGVSVSSPEHVACLLNAPGFVDGLDVVQTNASIPLSNTQLRVQLRRKKAHLALNSPYRKGDSELRESEAGRKSIYHRILSRCPDSVLLTGTKEPAHLAENVRHVIEWRRSSLETRYFPDGEYPDRSTDAITEDLKRYFQNLTGRPAYSGSERGRRARPSETADALTTLLVGSRKTRLGPAPGKSRYEGIRRRIERMVSNDRPVDIILTWAPRKFYAVYEENRVDAAELAAFERLMNLWCAAKTVYEKGVRYTIFYEDFEGQFIEQEAVGSFKHYGAGLQDLIDVLDLNDALRFVRTGDWVESSGNREEIESQLRENYRAIRDYWHESEDKGIDQSEQLRSYARMAELGFKGRIELETRRHYLNRLNRLLGEMVNEREKTEMVVRLFACVLLHRQFEMFSVEAHVQPLKFSFLKAAGGPGYIMEGRLDIRSIRADVTKRSLAPWSAKGFLRSRKGCIVPAARTWREAASFSHELCPGSIVFRRGGLSASVKADLLPDGADRERFD